MQPIVLLNVKPLLLLLLFDGNPDNTLQYIALFTQRCEETGVVGDFNFVSHENLPPSTVDLTDPIQATSW